MDNQQLFPVTEETFSQVWAHVDTLRRKARVKAMIAKIGGFLSNLFFLFGILLSVNGLIYTHFTGSYVRFLKSLPLFLTLWEPLSGLVASDAAIYGNGLKLLAVDYLASALVFALLAGLIHLLYHPRTAELPTGTYAENTALLVKKAQEAFNRSQKTEISTSIVSTVLVIASAFILLFAYAFAIQDAEKINAILSVFPFNDAATNSLLYVLFGLFLSHFLCTPLLLITRFLYRCKIPYDVVIQCQIAALYAQEPPVEASPEELAAIRAEKAAAIRQEALETETRHAYTKAKEMLLTAALYGDVSAMEHYARHCLIDCLNISARYWLEKCAASGEASPDAKSMLRRMNLRLRHNVEYLKTTEVMTPKQRRIRAVRRAFRSFGRLVGGLLSLAVLAGCCFAFYAVIDYEKKPAKYQQLYAKAMYLVSDEESPEIMIEEVSPFETPVMTMTIEKTKYADTEDSQNCVAYDESGAPVIFCYSKDMGGSLMVPANFYNTAAIKKAQLYTGNQWKMQNITEFVTFDPAARLLAVAEEYLQTLEPGEYYIMLDPIDEAKHSTGLFYLPLLVSETTTFNSTQRGLAALGNDRGWILYDMDAPAEITLPFYNLGDNPVRSLWKTTITITGMTVDTPIASELYSISDNGYIVTLKPEIFAEVQQGMYCQYKFVLANGEILEMGNVNICAVKSGDPDHLTITGPETYSLSKDGDLVLTYDMGIASMLYNVQLSHDGEVLLKDESLNDLTSDYVDFDNHIITFPKEQFADQLKKGDHINVSMGFQTVYGNGSFSNWDIEIVK